MQLLKKLPELWNKSSFYICDGKLKVICIISMALAELIHAPKAIGPYAQGWSIDNMVFTSDQLGMDITTGKLADGMEKQTHAAMKNLTAVLKQAGADLSDIVKTTVFVKNLDDFAVVNEIYGSHFADSYPARSCVQVVKLPLDGLVEIECIAVKAGRIISMSIS